MQTKSPFFIGLNWKANPSSWSECGQLLKQYQELEEEIMNSKNQQSNLSFSIFPPAIYLSNLIELGEDLALPIIFNFGLQDICEHKQGAYTGQITAQMGANLGASLALIGHSETRKYLAVDDHSVAKKIEMAIENNLQPLIAIGHSNQDGIDLNQLGNQVRTALQAYQQPSQIILAYEPVWAIGTGKIPTNQEIEMVFEKLTKVVLELNPEHNLQLLYGGSVDDKNVEKLLEINQLGGFLIGGASLKIDKLKAILTAVNKKMVN